jgi:hypothetical protein
MRFISQTLSSQLSVVSMLKAGLQVRDQTPGQAESRLQAQSRACFVSALGTAAMTAVTAFSDLELEKPGAEQLHQAPAPAVVTALTVAPATTTDETETGADTVYEPLSVCRFFWELLAMTVLAFIPPVVLYALVPFQAPHLGDIRIGAFGANLANNVTYVLFNYPVGTLVSRVVNRWGSQHPTNNSWHLQVIATGTLRTFSVLIYKPFW